MCYCKCRYENAYTGECENPIKYKCNNDAACYEEEQEEVEE